MHRRSIYLTPTLNYRLKATSKQVRNSVSAFVCDLLDQVLVVQERDKLDRVYTGLMGVRGIGKKGDTAASAIIDDVLYGDKDAWRGSDR